LRSGATGCLDLDNVERLGLLGRRILPHGEARTLKIVPRIRIGMKARQAAAIERVPDVS
jgi:hypothetical protein